MKSEILLNLLLRFPLMSAEVEEAFNKIGLIWNRLQKGRNEKAYSYHVHFKDTCAFYISYTGIENRYELNFSPILTYDFDLEWTENELAQLERFWHLISSFSVLKTEFFAYNLYNEDYIPLTYSEIIKQNEKCEFCNSLKGRVLAGVGSLCGKWPLFIENEDLNIKIDNRHSQLLNCPVCGGWLSEEAFEKHQKISQRDDVRLFMENVIYPSASMGEVINKLGEPDVIMNNEDMTLSKLFNQSWCIDHSYWYTDVINDIWINVRSDNSGIVMAKFATKGIE